MITIYRDSGLIPPRAPMTFQWFAGIKLLIIAYAVIQIAHATVSHGYNKYIWQLTSIIIGWVKVKVKSGLWRSYGSCSVGEM